MTKPKKASETFVKFASDGNLAMLSMCQAMMSHPETLMSNPFKTRRRFDFRALDGKVGECI